MNKTLRIMALVPYALVAWPCEGLRFLWWLWNRTHVMFPRYHSDLEVKVMHLLWRCPSLTIVEYRVREIISEETNG
jgi:hypothetical protein